MQIRDRLYIGGEWVLPACDDTIAVFDATTEEMIGQIPRGTAGDGERAIAAARKAFDSWSRVSPAERAKYTSLISESLGRRMVEISQLISHELGMPINLSMMIQLGLPIATFASMADLVGQLAWEETVGNSLVVREPVGVVGAITPWNYPLHQYRGQGGAGIGRRLHRRFEAERGRASQRLRPCRDHRRGRFAPRGLQPRFGLRL